MAVKRAIIPVAAIDGGRYFHETDVNNALGDVKNSLSLRTKYSLMGSNYHYASEKVEVELQPDTFDSKEEAELWISMRLGSERKLKVYHPQRTWFISYPQSEMGLCVGAVSVGTVTRRYQGLQQYLSGFRSGRGELAAALKALLSAIELYLELGNAGRVPDEGMSGFVLDTDNSVYYRGSHPEAGNSSTACARFLCECLQQFSWLDGEWVSRLGKGIAVLEGLVFNGKTGYCQTLADQLLNAQPIAGNRSGAVAQLASAIVPPKQKNVEKALALSLDDDELPVSASASLLTKAEPATSSQTEGKLAKQLVRTQGPRYVALISDIHANYTALDHVLYYLSKEGVTQGVVLGDIVGYGPDPSECIARVRETGFTTIKGNHDHAIAQKPEHTGMSSDAQTVINWTKDQLNAEDKAWLADLPPILENDEWMAVHGAPTDPHYFYGYIHSATSNANLDHIEKDQRQLCLHGHTHLPGAFVRDQGGRTFALPASSYPLVDISAYRSLLVCPGSVGQPRNGSALAQFAILDRHRRQVRFIGVEYPVHAVVKRMQARGLPSTLSQRLLVGR